MTKRQPSAVQTESREPVAPKTRKNSLSAQEICDIITTCAPAGVLEIKFQDLHVVFEAKSKPMDVPTAWTASSSSEHQTSEPEPETSPPKHRLEDEMRLREDQLAHMLLTNPLDYEDLTVTDELEDQGALTDAEQDADEA